MSVVSPSSGADTAPAPAAATMASEPTIPRWRGTSHTSRATDKAMAPTATTGAPPTDFVTPIQPMANTANAHNVMAYPVVRTSEPRPSRRSICDSKATITPAAMAGARPANMPDSMSPVFPAIVPSAPMRSRGHTVMTVAMIPATAAAPKLGAWTERPDALAGEGAAAIINWTITMTAATSRTFVYAASVKTADRAMDRSVDPARDTPESCQ